MAKCSNCGANLTCGCQRRVVNGVSGCNKCLPATTTKTAVKPKVNPTQTTWGKNRYNNLNKVVK